MEGVWFLNVRESALYFINDVVLLASSSPDFQHALGLFTAGMRVCSGKSVVLNLKKVGGSLVVRVTLSEEFKYQRVLISTDVLCRIKWEMDRFLVCNKKINVPVHCGELV